MRNPRKVLDILADKPKDYKYKRLYRNLYNQDFFLIAYQNIYHKEGNMTKGTDGKTIDGMSVDRIQKLIKSIRNESYQPNPSRRTYIDKDRQGKKKRPLGIPSVDDKLVQEVMKMILESIYEKSFSDNSHGFRPNRSCHTALSQVQKTGRGNKWWIDADIKSYFDTIDHHILIKIIRKNIKDERFIRLIWKFLSAGYMENWQYHKTYSGTPQGGIISPMLANIYLNELDQYMEKYKEQFDKGKRRKVNREYSRLQGRIYRREKKLRKKREQMTDEEIQTIKDEMKRYNERRLSIPYSDPMDEKYRRLKYTRYADDFIIGIVGSKDDARKIKDDVEIFLNERLNLKLSKEKTQISNSRNKIRFLGYDIKVERTYTVSRDKNGVRKRSHNEIVRLLVPKEKWVQSLVDKGILKFGKRSEWKIVHRPYLINLDDLEILSTYNSEIRGLYNYYKLASNVSGLWNYWSIMKWSMLKTLANKYKTTSQKIKKKYSIKGKFGVKYETKEKNKIRLFYDDGFRRDKSTSLNVDEIPNTLIYSGRTSLIDRLKAHHCEWCDEINDNCEVHHVRKLKDLKQKEIWEKVMIARNRKTMILCEKCHQKLHSGKLDGKNLNTEYKTLVNH